MSVPCSVASASVATPPTVPFRVHICDISGRDLSSKFLLKRFPSSLLTVSLALSPGSCRSPSVKRPKCAAKCYTRLHTSVGRVLGERCENGAKRKEIPIPRSWETVLRHELQQEKCVSAASHAPHLGGIFQCEGSHVSKAPSPSHPDDKCPQSCSATVHSRVKSGGDQISKRRLEAISADLWSRPKQRAPEFRDVLPRGPGPCTVN